MKYVVYEDGDFAIIPETMNHSDARIMGKTPAGAGFIDLSINDNGDVSAYCYGSSITLDLMSRGEEDEFEIEMGFRL